ncbi:MAG TPA: hypothetical protein PLP33_29990 [Leptospiraceae bacterium]|nr:hypothetical protein [Leptospiraceae bacterium]
MNKIIFSQEQWSYVNGIFGDIVLYPKHIEYIISISEYQNKDKVILEYLKFCRSFFKNINSIEDLKELYNDQRKNSPLEIQTKQFMKRMDCLSKL